MDRQELLKEIYNKVSKMAVAPVNSFSTFCSLHNSTTDKQLIEINNSLNKILKQVK